MSKKPNAPKAQGVRSILLDNGLSTARSGRRSPGLPTIPAAPEPVSRQMAEGEVEGVVWSRVWFRTNVSTPRGVVTHERIVFAQGVGRTRRRDGDLYCDLDLAEPVVKESSLTGAREEGPGALYKRYSLQQKRISKS